MATDINFLHAELLRVSDWIQIADKKAGFVSVYYASLVGYLFSQREEALAAYVEYGQLGFLFAIFCAALAIVIVTGVYHLFLSVLPRLNNKNTPSSIFFYGHVSTMSRAAYHTAMLTSSNETLQESLLEQIYTNSVIAAEKMRNIKLSILSLFIVTPLVILFAVLI